MRWLVGVAMVHCFLVAAWSGREPRTSAWLGRGDDGSSCWLEVGEASWSLGCGTGCVLNELRRGGPLRAGMWHDGELLFRSRAAHIDTAGDGTVVPLAAGRVLRVRWSELATDHDASSGLLAWPTSGDDFRWQRWSAIAALLCATWAAWLWHRRPRAVRSDLVQLAVHVPTWPPRGELEVLALRPPASALPRADWPGRSIQLADAPLGAAVPGPGVWWVAGRREGGRGGGLRELAPRLVPGERGYQLARRPRRPARAPAPPAAPVSRTARCLWLVALLAPAAAGSVDLGLLLAAALMALVVAAFHDWTGRLAQRGIPSVSSRERG